MRSGEIIHIGIVPDYKPGDDPPDGYVQWHAWADAQHNAGLSQTRCVICGLANYPQELTTLYVITEGIDARTGDTVRGHQGVCKECEARAAAIGMDLRGDGNRFWFIPNDPSGV